MVGRLHAALSALLIFASAAPSAACGFEDPSSVTLQRGVLNWVYPESLHVSTAVWQAQRAGIVAKDRLPPGKLAVLGLRMAQLQMRRLGMQTTKAAGSRPVPAFSVVLVGPMLWTSFEDAGDTVKACVHVPGPTPDDVVMVTEDVVVAALLTGSLDIRDAYDLGLIRYYGDDADISALVQVLADLPPLPDRTALAISDGDGKVPKTLTKVVKDTNADDLSAQC